MLKKEHINVCKKVKHMPKGIKLQPTKLNNLNKYHCQAFLIFLRCY